ncbi:MAG: hypothetical protein OEZ36_12800, partial [Spirochaetota bacterium]|nr:hypothetical protein [Spirochaetota bacterium]
SRIAFINIFLVFLLAETVLLIFHLSLNYNPILAEFLFYIKFIVIAYLMRLIAKSSKNLVLKSIILLSIFLTGILFINMIFFFLIDTGYSLILFRLASSGEISLMAAAKLIYTELFKILIYNQRVLPLILFTINFVISIIFIKGRGEYYKPYSRLLSRLNSRYPV